MFHYSLLFFYVKTDVKNSKVVIRVINCVMLQVKFASCAGYCSPYFTPFSLFLMFPSMLITCIYICRENVGKQHYGNSFSGNIPQTHCLSTLDTVLMPKLYSLPLLLWTFCTPQSIWKILSFFFLLNCRLQNWQEIKLVIGQQNGTSKKAVSYSESMCHMSYLFRYSHRLAWWYRLSSSRH